MPPGERRDGGLHAAFRSVFLIVKAIRATRGWNRPIELGEPVFDVRECQLRGLITRAAAECGCGWC